MLLCGQSAVLFIPGLLGHRRQEGQKAVLQQDGHFGVGPAETGYETVQGFLAVLAAGAGEQK